MFKHVPLEHIPESHPELLEHGHPVFFEFDPEQLAAQYGSIGE